MAKIDLDSGHLDSEQRITLGLLNAVHENERLSQRSLASDLSIALGLTNSYLKRCIKKGLIKVKQAPANRYAYYLTPRGLSEKTRLTAEFLSQSLNLFRVSREEANKIFHTIQNFGWQNVTLVGDGDLVEIFVLSAPTEAVDLTILSAHSQASSELHGVSQVSDLAALKSTDVAIICDLRNPAKWHRIASEILPEDRILAPGFLGLSKKSPSPKGDSE